jgi:hypothetical protein
MDITSLASKPMKDRVAALFVLVCAVRPFYGLL